MGSGLEGLGGGGVGLKAERLQALEPSAVSCSKERSCLGLTSGILVDNIEGGRIGNYVFL